MNTEQLLQIFYSGPQYDGTTRFYDWIREYASPESRVLNYGAGPATVDRRRSLKGYVAEIVGADIDPIVLQNEELDNAVMIVGDETTLEAEYFDLVYSDFVLEHVERPEMFLKEVFRVLKPGGSFFFRTPCLYHYVAIVSALTSQRFHLQIANKVRGLSEKSHDPWPTFYRMNTRSRLRRLANVAGFDEAQLRMLEFEPSYLQFNPALFLLGLAYERTVNATRVLENLRGNIFGRLVK
ncbi:class I SAM-dependent methyltransferase [uncultured Rhodoblastus sp.]|uniref:class I SAM-dependent methyltransferase n=1 Tax=uncultured Rhodoblastus sp. TaxID=543037 RepID=UPI0025E99551|nr:class I SAM-dependent methyltransferase [uncultured Rhodoblastus sp.]